MRGDRALPFARIPCLEDNDRFLFAISRQGFEQRIDIMDVLQIHPDCVRFVILQDIIQNFSLSQVALIAQTDQLVETNTLIT